MTLKSDRWSGGSRLFHWVTALLIFILLPLGMWMTGLPFSDFKLELYNCHKTLGLLVLILFIARIGWRMAHTAPAELSSHAVWEKKLAAATHVLLYALLFLIPLSGWVMSSAGEFPVIFFGQPVPPIAPKNEWLFDVTREAHEIMAFVLAFLIGLHIAGALKHFVIDRDFTLQRMVPLIRGQISYLFLGAVLAAFALGVGTFGALTLKKMFSAKGEVAIEAESDIAEAAADNVDIIDTDGWVILASESLVSFIAQQSGTAINGSFGSFSGVVTFDPENPEAGNGEIIIDLASAKTGSVERDQQLGETAWFDIEMHPIALYTIERFEKMDDADLYRAVGFLELKGVTTPLNLPFSLKISGDRALAQGAFVLNRLDYNIGDPRTDYVSDSVQVRFDVTAER